MTDFPDWQEPQAAATAISTTGVPLIRNITVLSTSNALAPNTTTTLTTVVYGDFYEGYLLEVIPQSPGTKIFTVDLLVSHLDASGNTVAIEPITVSNFVNVGNDTSIIRGKLLGTQLSVQVVTASSAFMNTITGGVITADSVKVRFCGLQTFLPGTGKRVPIITAAGGLLMASSESVPLGGVSGVATLVGVMPDYTGAVVVSTSTTTGGGLTFAARIDSYTVSNGTAVLATWETSQVNSTSPVAVQYSLPSCFNLLRMVQHSTVSSSAGANVLISAADQ